jgi:hypothetical protein
MPESELPSGATSPQAGVHANLRVPRSVDIHKINSLQLAGGDLETLPHEYYQCLPNIELDPIIWGRHIVVFFWQSYRTQEA